MRSEHEQAERREEQEAGDGTPHLTRVLIAAKTEPSCLHLLRRRFERATKQPERSGRSVMMPNRKSAGGVPRGGRPRR